MLRQWPLLVPQDLHGRVYDGFLSLQDKDFRLRIILPSDLQLQNAKIQCSWPLKNALQGYQQILKQRLQQSSHLPSFLMELKTILEAALKNTNTLQMPAAPQYYSCLVKEIEDLGWEKLLFVDTDFSTIQLKVEDCSGREHLITLRFTTRYPNEAPDCSIDLPVPFAISWAPKSSLHNIVNQVKATLESLKDFWDALDEIDKKTWVLEPEKPTRSATLRRIALGSNVSITIDLDPRHPTMLPECYFLGADHVVNPLREKLNCNVDLWDPQNGLLQNLKDVLETEFPLRSTLEKADFSMDCGICYSYRLESAIPDQVCDDPHCGQPFHQACLYEWLRGLTSSRQSFNVIYGECPYCNKPITLKLSTKRS